MAYASRKEALHRRALRLEWFTVLWNVIEVGVAIVAVMIAGSTALIAFGADSLIEVTSAVGAAALKPPRPALLRQPASAAAVTGWIQSFETKPVDICKKI